MKTINRWILIFLGSALVFFGLAAITLEQTDLSLVFEALAGLEEEAKNLRSFEEKGRIDPAITEDLLVETIDAQITVSTHEGDEILWTFSGAYPEGKQPRLETNRQGTRVHLVTKMPSLTGFGIGSHAHLTLKLPAQFEKDLRLKTTSGDVTLKHKRLREVELESVSGNFDVHLEGLEGLKLETVSGDVGYHGQVTGDLGGKTTSGDIQLALETYNNLALSSTSGDLLIRGPVLFQSLTMDTVSGDLIYRAKTGKVQNESDRHMEVEVANQEGFVRLETVSGKIQWEEVSP